LDEEYEVALVFQSSVWRRTHIKLDQFDFVNTSLSVTRKLGLDFALLIWAVAPDRGQIRLGRINPWPSRDDVDFAWGEMTTMMARRFRK